MPRFSLAPVDELHLDRAPLAKVLMQVQYSRTPQLVTDATEALIADVLGRYPVRRRQVTAGLVPNIMINGQPLPVPNGFNPGVALLFADPKATWQVSITDTAVALETGDYSTRDDFCERSAEVFAAIAAVALPPVVDRVGLRYIDRLSGDALVRVPDYIIPELRALFGCVEAPLAIHHSLTESQIELGVGEQMLVRSGLLPAGGAIDPSLPPIDQPSWILDMDVFTTSGGFAFEPAELTARLRRHAEAAYSFFRFATTEKFQEAHRGEPATSSRTSYDDRQ
jgi:uncharacterized protein (TIGR04255 family)